MVACSVSTTIMGRLVALAHGVVVLVVRGRHLHHARAEFLVHVLVGDHRDLAVGTAAGSTILPMRCV